jgi:hypothetical protein
VDISQNEPADHGIEDVTLVDNIAPAGFDETAAGTYRRAQCVVFRKTNERWGGLSNMAAGFPLWVNGIDIRTSEAIDPEGRVATAFRRRRGSVAMFVRNARDAEPFVAADLSEIRLLVDRVNTGIASVSLAHATVAPGAETVWHRLESKR